MTFVKFQNDNKWWLYEEKYNSISQINASFQKIYPDDPKWKEAEIINLDSWFQLCKLKNYYPTETGITERDLWVDPDGRCFQGEAHELQAEYLCEYLYDMHLTMDSFPLTAADLLIKAGWVKLTTSLMHDYYIEDGMYDKLTIDQIETIRSWELYHFKKLNITKHLWEAL